MAAASAFNAPATPTIVSHYQPNPTYAYEVRGLAYDGMPENRVEPMPVAPPPSSGIDTEIATPPDSPPHTPETVVVTAEAIDIPALICSYGWDCATALRIARCESGLTPTARNGVFLGLFQIWSAWFPHFGYDVNDWADPAVNVQVAYLIYASSGFSPWQCK